MLNPYLYNKITEEAQTRLNLIKAKETEIKKLQDEVAFLRIEYNAYKEALGK